VKREALRSAFWSAAGGVSVRTKIMGLAAGPILLLAVMVILHVRSAYLRNFRAEVQERGKAIGFSLAARSRDLVLTNNLFALYAMAKETATKNPDVRYVFIADTYGEIVVHTFEGGFPEDLLRLGGVPAGMEYGTRILETEEGLIQDIVVPILEGKVGVVHLGLSEGRLSDAVANRTWSIISVAAVVLAIGLLVAYALATLLTRPILKLVEMTKAIGRGELKWRAPIWAKEVRTRLLERVISAQEEERRRIARELHDETGQSLTSLALGLQALEGVEHPEELKARTVELRSLVAKTLEEVHLLARALRPSILDDLGLVAALDRCVKGYEAATGLRMDFIARGFDGRRLPLHLETALYRIVQEALTNVVKHAQARNVSVLLERRGRDLVAVVEDDGQGFDIDAARHSRGEGQGLGIIGIEERVSLAGGRFTVESKPGMGTTVVVEMPLEPPEENYGEGSDPPGR
jgi:signal transduction histidine kinase